MSINLIAAGTFKKNKFGIGYKNKLPWSVPEDISFFKNLIKDKIVLVGSTTYESIFSFINCKKVLILSKNKKGKGKKQGHLYINDFENSILEFINFGVSVYIIGGAEIYNKVLRMDNLIDKFYFTEIFSKTPIECDSYIERVPWNYKLIEYTDKIQSTNQNFQCRFMVFLNTSKINDIYDINCKYVRSISEEGKYIDLITKILKSRNLREDRTGTGTLSLCAEQLRYNISENVPIFTTKSVPWKSAIEELLWMLRGSVDTKELEDKKINIWKGHTSREFLDSRGLTDYPEGQLLYGYGHQIRNAGGDTIKCNNCESDIKIEGTDQLKKIEESLRSDPFSRRHIWNLWTANQIDKMPLPPCHNQVQFYVEKIQEKMYLTCVVSLRSNDIFLGNPFNTVAYTVLTYILALRTGMLPKELVINIGDAHIYLNHVNQVTEQISRYCRSLPVLVLDEKLRTIDWNEMNISHFDLVGYYPDKSIKAPMAI